MIQWIDLLDQIESVIILVRCPTPELILAGGQPMGQHIKIVSPRQTEWLSGHPNQLAVFVVQIFFP